MASEAIKTTVELFAGIGGFRLAAAQKGLQTLWANDICPKACQVYRSQFGDTEIRQGDIRELTHEIPSHDLLTAGFPCQPFSSAGQKKGFRDPRGLLFSVIVEVLRTHRPRYFILENVKRLLLFDFTESTLQRLEESTEINRFLDGVQLLYNQKRGARMGYTVFGIDGIAPTLTAATSRHYERYKVGDRYRRLTNVEYARLQGFPDDHCSAVSVYNQYSLYGNAIPPVLAGWVLDKILENRVTSLENVKEQQLHLFQEPITYADSYQ